MADNDPTAAWPRLRYEHATGEVLTSEDGLAVRLRTTAEALRVFAQITPSTLHTPDGSDRERYSVVLAEQVRESGDFDGEHLADARAILARLKQEGLA